jgi:hypothetical protein
MIAENISSSSDGLKDLNVLNAGTVNIPSSNTVTCINALSVSIKLP